MAGEFKRAQDIVELFHSERFAESFVPEVLDKIRKLEQEICDEEGSAAGKKGFRKGLQWILKLHEIKRQEVDRKKK